MSSGKVHAITSIKAHLGSLDLCAGKKEGPQMGLEFLWLILAVVLGGYVFVLGFLKRFNEWYYVGRLGKTQYPLPPGDTLGVSQPSSKLSNLMTLIPSSTILFPSN